MTAQSEMTVLVAVLGALWITAHFPIEYRYLKYVTLGQFGKRLWRGFLGCLGWSIGLSVLNLLPTLSPDSSFSTFFKELPDFVWFVLLTGYFTWSLGGTTLEFPKLKHGQWIVLNIVLIVAAGLLDLSWEALPHIFTGFVYILLWQAAEMYETLVEAGRSNSESMGEMPR
jgi:hypothetical protein